MHVCGLEILLAIEAVGIVVYWGSVIRAWRRR